MHAPAPDVVVTLCPDDLHAILDSRVLGASGMLDAVRGALENGVKEAVQLASPRTRVVVRWDPDASAPRVVVHTGSDALRAVVLQAIERTVARVRGTLRAPRRGSEGDRRRPEGPRADLDPADVGGIAIDDGWRRVMDRHPTTLEIPAVGAPALPWWERRRAPRR